MGAKSTLPYIVADRETPRSKKMVLLVHSGRNELFWPTQLCAVVQLMVVAAVAGGG